MKNHIKIHPVVLPKKIFGVKNIFKIFHSENVIVENKAEASQPGVNVGSIFGVPTTEVKGGVFGGSGTTTEVKGGVFGGSGSSVSFSFSSLAKQTETASSGAFSSGTGVSFAELAKQTDSSTSMFGGNSGHGSGSGFSFSDLAKQADSSTSPSFKVQGNLVLLY